MSGSKPGERRGGRQAGTPNKITSSLREMILGALEDAGGEAYLARIAEEHPVAFMTLLGKVLSATLAGEQSAPIISRLELVPIMPRLRERPAGCPDDPAESKMALISLCATLAGAASCWVILF